MLIKGNLIQETQSLLIAAQNNTIRINYVKQRIDKTQQHRKYRLCGDRDETINYIINKCSNLAKKKTHKTRHDWVEEGNPLRIEKEIEILPYKRVVYAK